MKLKIKFTLTLKTGSSNTQVVIDTDDLIDKSIAQVIHKIYGKDFIRATNVSVIKFTEKQEKNYSKEAEELYDFFIESRKLFLRIKNHKKNDWVEIFERMINKDTIPIEEIKFVIKRIATDNFWQKIILSPKNLRKHYNQLIVKFQDNVKRDYKSDPEPSFKKKIL